MKSTAALSALLTGLLFPLNAAEITSAEYLARQPKPNFKVGHTLPRLSRFGWSLPLETRLELARNWGFALEFGTYLTPATIKRLEDPKSLEAQIVAASLADPKALPLAVICSRELPKVVPAETYVRKADGEFAEGTERSLDGNVWNDGRPTIYSPASPDSVWKEAGELRAAPLRALAATGAPIAIVLNGGEYGVGVFGSSGALWKQDPAILAEKSEEDWYHYISRKKGRFESFISEAVRKAVPDRRLYIYYTAGGGTHRNKDQFYKEWQYQPEALIGISDLPSNEVYFKHHNDGFTGRLDVLTVALNAVANEIKLGHPFSYNWTSAGWDDKGHADLERWGGFLTCYMSAGMVGWNDGYYRFPEDRFSKPFPEDAPPRWLLQLICASRIQARMSHHEHFIRNSELLPGPLRHALSKDDPAYEFPTGDQNARVLVRKKKQSPEWLITAWAADGAEREVEITVPELGKLTVTASPSANLYSAVIGNDAPLIRKLEEPASKS